MAIVVFEHDPIDRISRLGEVLNDQAHRLNVRLLNEGDSVPPDLDNVDGLIVMGGRQNVDEQDRHAWMPRELEYIRQCHEARIPVVGICLGAQLVATALGGKVEKMPTPEIGWHPVQSSFPGTIDPLLTGIPWSTWQFHAHGYQVTQLPPGATPLAGSKMAKVQAFKVGQQTYAFQYHFEWTRQDIQRMLRAAADWVRSAGQDPEQIRQQMDDRYDLYRHMGDRLCRNITDLLLPIDKRLGVTVREVANYHAQIS